MTVLQLTSKDNALLKKIRLVSSGSNRAPELLVVVEGVRMLEEVNRAGCKIEAVVLSPSFGNDSREKDLLYAWYLREVHLYRTSDSLFKSISSVQTPQGAIALVRAPSYSLEDIVPAQNALVLCTCGIQDPGNLGTLIRTAAAAGGTLMCTTQGTVSARNPKTLRSSAGAFFRLPLVEHVKEMDFLNFCQSHSIRVYRTDARNGELCTETDLRNPCAILLGNEGSGMSADEFAQLPSVRVPMAEGMESLNVAIAGAIILFEAFRQRQAL
jgi:TrmH family RNA methyltransferase